MHGPGRHLTGHFPGRLSLTRAAGPLALAVAALLWPAVAANPAGTKAAAPVSGSAPAVGALFTTRGGQLGTHFCTASVVDSPAGELLVTAAHCVTGFSDTSPAGLGFVPGYNTGRAPYGIWTVTRIFVDASWAAAGDPDDDVAFLVVRQPGRAASIQDLTGGERLGIGEPPAGVVRVTGYPDGQQQPVSCQNQVSAFGPGQLVFDCDNFTNGTSGSAFLADVDQATGEGTVIGVIGGYEQGGDTPDVSYAAVFGSGVQALYDSAVGRG